MLGVPPLAGRAQRPGRGAARLGTTATAYALLAPSLFGVAVFLLLPMLVVVWLSLYRWDLLGPMKYVGLANWHSVLSDSSFGMSLLVTVAFIALVVPVQTVLGLFAAAMLARDLPGSGFFRTLYVLPWICSPLAIGVLWRWLLAPTDGAVSTVLGHRIEWLTDPQLALPLVVGGDDLDQRRLRDAVLPGRHPRRSRRESTTPRAPTGPTRGSGSAASRCPCCGPPCSSSW